MNKLSLVTTAALLATGLIHLLPLVGVLGAERIAALYGVTIAGPDLAILMRHRAVLFGAIGTLCVVAAFHRPLQPVALAIAGCSVLSFLALAWSVGGYNAAIGRVVAVDLAAALLLLAGAAAALVRHHAV